MHPILFDLVVVELHLFHLAFGYLLQLVVVQVVLILFDIVLVLIDLELNLLVLLLVIIDSCNLVVLIVHLLTLC